MIDADRQSPRVVRPFRSLPGIFRAVKPDGTGPHRVLPAKILRLPRPDAVAAPMESARSPNISILPTSRLSLSFRSASCARPPNAAGMEPVSWL